MATNDFTSETTMNFRRIGGSSQLVIESAADLKNALALDPAHWALTSIPAPGLLCDPEFLALLMQDDTGRIRVKNVRQLLQWMIQVMRDLSGVIDASAALSLECLNPDNADGALARETAELALRNIGRSDDKSITFEQISDFKAIVSNALQNGDGIIPPEPVSDPNAADCIRFAMAAVGSRPDLSGTKGVGMEEINAFESMLRTFLAWVKEGRSRADVLFPFGSATDALWKQFHAIASDVDAFFDSCRAIVYTGGSSAGSRVVSNTFDPFDRSSVGAFFEKAPLAPADPSCVLRLSERINPNKADALTAFFDAFRASVPGDSAAMDESEWLALKAAVSPYGDWLGRKNTDKLDAFDPARLREIADSSAFSDIRALIAADTAVSKNVNSCDLVRKIILCQKNFREFLNNFVSMEALFEPAKHSIILAGKLVMDGRHFLLCMIVNDLAAHKKIAASSNICVMYLNASTGKGAAAKKMTLAAAVTSGSMRNLFIGKTGVFYTADGVLWDAVVIDFIQQPVSVSEAVKMPFYKFGEILQKQADKYFSAKSGAYEAQLTKGIDAKLAGSPAPAADPAKKDNSIFSGSMLLMGGGVGIAAIGSGFAFMAKSLQGVSVLTVLAILAGIIFIFGAPIIISSLVKLFRRSLTRFLEANGYALNREMRLSLALGRVFTYTPRLPARKLVFSAFTPKINDENADTPSPQAPASAQFRILLIELISFLLLAAAVVWVWITFVA